VDGDENLEAIISAERLNFFADAVVAIAITLLALNLPVPVGRSDGEVWRDLTRNANDYIAFLVSFAVVGRYWLVHHRVFVHLRRVSVALSRWTMLWLLMIVLTPFATRVVVANGGFGARFTIYAGVQALASIFLLLAVREMDRGGLTRPGTPAGAFRATYIGSSLAAGAFLLSIPLAFVTKWAFVLWIAIPLLPRLFRRFGRRFRPL
jgi:uncharacterized membrane protein